LIILFNFQFFTLSVGLVIVSALTMIRYVRLLKHYEKGAKELDRSLAVSDDRSNKTAPNTNKKIVITSDNEKERIELPESAVLFIESADNYSKIVYTDGNHTKTAIIRSSLKRTESLLTGTFYRCHRSFIVQLGNVQHISGNSQGYRLHFKNSDQAIPVARGSGKELKEKLEQLRGIARN
jgi:DNA-binding LytR/AlgR family response regulator